MKMLTFDGVTQPMSEWALDYGITTDVIRDRLKRGWSVESAITRPIPTRPGAQLPEPDPPKKNGRVIAFAGLELTIRQWADRNGLNPSALAMRLRSGWPLAKALQTPMKPRKDRRPGVVYNLGGIAGTGAGSTAQETPEITFPEKAHSQ